MVPRKSIDQNRISPNLLLNLEMLAVSTVPPQRKLEHLHPPYTGVDGMDTAILSDREARHQLPACNKGRPFRPATQCAGSYYHLRSVGFLSHHYVS